MTGAIRLVRQPAGIAFDAPGRSPRRWPLWILSTVLMVTIHGIVGLSLVKLSSSPLPAPVRPTAFLGIDLLPLAPPQPVPPVETLPPLPVPVERPADISPEPAAGPPPAPVPDPVPAAQPIDASPEPVVPLVPVMLPAATPVLAVPPPSVRPPRPRRQTVRAEPPRPVVHRETVPPLERLVVPTPAAAIPTPEAIPVHEAESSPPVPAGTAARTWQGALVARLERFKRYPAAARARQQQGVALVHFVIDRDGQVLSSQLIRSSDSSALDDESLALLQRAAPLPPPPDAVTGERIELTVPIRFSLTR
ncbi:MAG: TonB family protein [Azospirillaceae bacterium]|nr:TonB family protein [Azospirillaceae bacterium]